MIELIKVDKVFKSKKILENISLKIDKAGIYTFVGDNGIGKTTLLNIINKSVKPSSGKVINKHKNISFVSQKVNLINHLTVKDHLDIYGISCRCLTKFKLYNKINSYPSELSLGQRQRVSVIIGLYSKSSLLILDEPTSHLDSKNSELLFKEIKKVSEYKTVILVSHNDELVNRYSDVIYKIENRSITNIVSNNINKQVTFKKSKLNFRSYTRKSIFKNKRINLICIVIIFILSSLLLLANTLSYSISSIVEEEKKYSLDYNKFYLRECVFVYKNEVNIKKCSNLSEEKLRLLKNYKVSYNLDVLMNSLYEIDKFNVINDSNYILKEGRYPLKYNEIITNENYQIGDIITLNASKIITHNRTDLYFKSLSLEVVGTVENKHFVKEDKYYIDYALLSNYLKGEQLINNDIDLYSYFELLEIDNYKYVLYFDDIDISVLENNDIQYLSSSYEYYEELEKLSEEIKTYLIYLNCFLIPICLYYFIKLTNKKIKMKEQEVLFLKANLFKEKRVLKLICKEQTKLTFYSFVISVLVVIALCLLIFKGIYIDWVSVFIIYIFLKIIGNKIVKITYKRRMKI